MFKVPLFLNYSYARGQQASELMNPPLKTKFQQVLLDQQEHVYNSKRRAPLGTSHDQSPGLPQTVNPSQTMFGLTTIKNESAGATVNPAKSQEEVDNEYAEGRELYKKVSKVCDVIIAEVVDTTSTQPINEVFDMFISSLSLSLSPPLPLLNLFRTHTES